MRQSHLSLSSLNHVSFVVSDLAKSVQFYSDVLGFIEVARPSSFDFQGAWLWRHGMAIHLIQGTPLPRPAALNPLGDHLSFQAQGSLEAVEEQLRDLGIPYARQEVVEGGIVVDQVFFHDPDRVMIEVCNCESLPVCPILQSASPVKPIPEGCIVETRTLLEQNVRKGMGGGSGSSTPLSGRSTMELLDVDDGEMEA